jgi:hypothetical protein
MLKTPMRDRHGDLCAGPILVANLHGRRELVAREDAAMLRDERDQRLEHGGRKRIVGMHRRAEADAGLDRRR